MYSTLLLAASATEMPCPKGWHCPIAKKEVNICHPKAPNCIGDAKATNNPKDLQTAIDENFAAETTNAKAPKTVSGMHFEQADSDEYDFPAPIIPEYSDLLQDMSNPFDIVLKCTNMYKGHGYTKKGNKMWYSGKAGTKKAEDSESADLQQVIKVAPIDDKKDETNGCPCCGPQVSYTTTTVSDGHGGGYVYGQSYCSDGCHYGKGCCQQYHYYPTCAGTAYCGSSSQYYCGPPACHYGGYPCDTVNGELDPKCPRYPCMTESERNPFWKKGGFLSGIHLPKRKDTVEV